MLALTRKPGQSVYIYGPKGEQIARIDVVRIYQLGHVEKVTLSFDSPIEYSIFRDDVIKKEIIKNDVTED